MKEKLLFLYRLLGVETSVVSHKEKLVAMVGGFIALFCLYLVSHYFLGLNGGAMLVASMGASAILVFAVPHGQLSQPWSVFGGHVISAFIGVSCAKLFSNNLMAVSVAVSMATIVMYYLRCIHPPGGATALTAVLGGETIQQLGYGFVVTPVLLNVTLLIILATLYNGLFSWRSYPAFWHQYKTTPPKSRQTPDEISHADFVYALSQIDTFIDVNEHELLRIYDLATQKSKKRRIEPARIAVEKMYSNGAYGEEWAVRQILDISTQGDISYQIVAGRQRRTKGQSSRKDFSNWAKYQVMRDEENWRRVT